MVSQALEDHGLNNFQPCREFFSLMGSVILKNLSRRHQHTQPYIPSRRLISELEIIFLFWDHRTRSLAMRVLVLLQVSRKASCT